MGQSSGHGGGVTPARRGSQSNGREKEHERGITDATRKCRASEFTEEASPWCMGSKEEGLFSGDVL